MSNFEEIEKLLQVLTVEAAEAKERFNCIFENAPVSLQLLTAEGKTIRVNSAWRRLWDLDGEFVDKFILKEYNLFKDPLFERNGIRPQFEKALSGKRVQLGEFLYDPAENGFPGRKRVTRPLLCPIKNAQGKLIEILLVQEDVTEQHESLENQQFLADMAAIMLESLDYDTTLEHIAISSIPYFADGCMVDLLEDGEIRRVVTKHIDPAIEEIMRELQRRFPPKVGSPHPTGKVFRSGRHHLLARVDQKAISEHTCNEEHAELIKKTKLNSQLAVPLIVRGETVGSLNFWKNSQRLPFGQRDLKLAREISRYAALAFDNARLYRDAQGAISQREDFISMASHELKTPVTALMLQMEIIQTILREPENLDTETLHKVSLGASRQLDQLSALIENMLDLTRVYGQNSIPLKRFRVELGSLVEDVLQRFSEQLEVKGIEVELNRSREVIVECDPDRVDQVLTNLVMNAILYGLGRTIAIKVETRGPRALCSVKDQGVGIALRDQERIFQRFERVSKATDGKGLGLGLFISRQIIEEHGGKLYVESELGKGSTFVMELPLP